MNLTSPKIKLAYITGLREVVLDEIIKNPNYQIINEEEDSIYLDYASDINEIKKLRSASRAYVVLQDQKYNPTYISNHKSILGNLIEIVLGKDKSQFQTFKITCAGSDSQEVRSISEYVQKTYQVREEERADLKIHIIKPNDGWEIGVQITPRPLSVRDYKARNMRGAMDPTIAYALNSLCKLEQAKSYLNVFSGSATLLIEAGLSYPDLEQLIGFDNNKEHLSLAIQNIKKAGLIKKIQIREADIFNKPNFGTFDVITSDLPFGMSISKDEDLERLYQSFIGYCENVLNPKGRLAIYTSEQEIVGKLISKSKFKIIKTLQLRFMTSVNAYLRPKIFVCRLK